MQVFPHVQDLRVAPSSSTSDEWWRSRLLVGGFVVSLHLLACFFYSGMTKLHLYIQRTPEAAKVVGFLGDVVSEYFTPVVVASIALTIVHGLAIVYLCWRTLPSLARCTSQGPADTDTRNQSLRKTTTRCSCIKTAQIILAQWDHKLEHFCGADSHELLVFVEIGLQTFQAYKLSHLVAAPWINRLMVLVIVINCWFMPIVSVIFRKKTPSFVRVVHLAIDAVLEIVYGMFISLAIFYPYYRDAYHIMFDTPFINFYMDTWYVGAIAENRQIFVTSWLDFCSKMAPGISLFLRLLALQNQRSEHESRVRTATLAKIALDDADFRSTTLHKKKTIVSGAMFLFGLGVLAVHLTANAVSFAGRDPGCLLEMMPFGSMQYTCAVLEVSCTQKKITGTKSELDEALSKVDPNTLQGLIFSHCEALSMPPRLKTFPKLLEIKIHNCSIAEWGEDAAVTGEEHPALQNLYVTMTNMSSIPDGLLSPKFPLSLTDVEFCGTNLTELPIDVFEKWPMVLVFYLELSPGITEFPPGLLYADHSVRLLSLSSNSITSLPNEVFVGHEYEVVMLSGNPLARLPDEVRAAFAMSALTISFTDVADVPASWSSASDELIQAAMKHGFFMPAQATPLCAKLIKAQLQAAGASSGSNNSSDDAVEDLSWVPIECSESQYSKPLYYPLELEKQWRAQNRV